MGPWSIRATSSHLPGVALTLSVFIPDWPSWPKNSYKNTTLEAFPRGGGEETWNHKTEAKHAKIGGGNVAGAVPSCFLNLSNCREYAQEAIIKWLLSYSMFMINIYFSC
jgi:hypothetical protein